MNGWLADQAVLVTGGGSGLGRAIVERFVDEGARVAVLDRSPGKLATLGGDVVTVTGDVTSPEDNAAAVAAAVDAFGGLDVFVGNAGLWDFGRSLADTTFEDLSRGFDELFAVNVKGYLLGARAAVDALRVTQGSMIFTLSNAAFHPGGGGSLYTASKHAGLGLVRQLAYELAPRVRVNGVAPGLVATDLCGPGALGLGDASIADAVPIETIMKEHTALERVAVAGDYVGPYVLLASRAGAPTATGTVLDVSSFGIPRRPDRAGS